MSSAIFLAGPAVVFSLVDLARIERHGRSAGLDSLSLEQMRWLSSYRGRTENKKKKRKYPKIRLEDFFLFCFSDIFGVELMLGREPAIIIIFQFL